MGIIGNAGFGVENSGIVSEVGSTVTDLKVGDRVMFLVSNCFSTRSRIAAQRCVKLPSSISWEEAASMPCVYATVIHSLLDVGGLQKGHSVLIHSACGGIGLAAIQICQYIGEITVSSFS
jgi:NADPH:quinone reductase-like Zn-dependent oxidoreductase